MKRALIIFGLLALIVALPISMRRETVTVSPEKADDRLVIITPHNESIREEFGEAFAGWWKKRTGRTIYVDWRTPGGTSEIRMVLDAGFKAAKETKREGIGIDVFFGGGEPDFASQARQGRLAPLDVFNQHPEWFGEQSAIQPGFTGETYYPPDHVWVGCCVSRFGVAYNPDVLKRLGAPIPQRWDDLGDPKLMGAVALADPTKSGSVARAFELVVQDQMQRALANAGPDLEKAKSEGWDNGMRLILKMGANARYFTDSASKVPHDIGQGDAAAGMCIDFYGRSYHQEMIRQDGTSRVDWRSPVGGATLSADPIAVLNGAPHAHIAQAFVEFVLSPKGQTLWSGKPGTPGGPKTHALYRSPIRRDVYTPENLANSISPESNPYTDGGAITYNKELTGKSFNTLRNIVKIACIDSHEEMKHAWMAMKAAGFPEEAMTAFSNVSAISYDKVGKGDPVLDGSDPLKAAAKAAELGEWFRANYRMAEHLAKQAPKLSTTR